jgi:hypothetical protein
VAPDEERPAMRKRFVYEVMPEFRASSGDGSS